MDGPASFIIVIVLICLVLCALVGAIVWIYSAQSAKRRLSQPESKEVSRSRNGN
jgi:flagellar basal body-associated protein FliL